MVKFVLIMFICSSVPGNECKLMSTPVDQFDTYHECAIYGYEHSTQLLKNFNFEQIYIFYPSLRIYLASVLSNIKKIYCYPLFKSKNLHLVNAAKEFTEKSLKIKNCPTETKFFINKVTFVKIDIFF